MSLIQPDQKFVADAIGQQLNKEAELIIDEEAEKAAEEVRRRLKSKIVDISTHVMQRFDISSMGGCITIRVQMEDIKR